VLLRTIPKNWLHHRFSGFSRIFAVMFLSAVAIASLRLYGSPPQNMPALIGRIEGEDVEVKTTTPTGMEVNNAPTVVASTSDVSVRTGQALITLDGGGEISVCGPAHFTFLKSGNSVTLALDYGRVHPSMESPESLIIYTPTIIATPIAIGGGNRDMTLGLDQAGEMCVMTTQGAMRIEPQFSDQSLIIPQGGLANLEGGQIKSLQPSVNSCSCDYARARLDHANPAHVAEITELSAPHQPDQKVRNPSVPMPDASQQPIYTVIMPPLSFDANSPAPPPDPSPATVLLVREVRLRPVTVFHGHVKEPPLAASVAVPPPTEAVPASPRPAGNRTASAQPGIFGRIRDFFRGIKSKPPCSGPGCG
jgi:hypothetical protein